MNEENKGTSKNKWSRIFRKKWFFPAVYLTIAAVLLSVVVWYQNNDSQVPDAQDEGNEYTPAQHGERAEPVMEQQETIKMPIADEEEAEIVTKFYDYNADQKEQEQALVLYNNKYYESDGVNIASASGKSFDVVAALSGEITEVKEDPLLGNVVVLEHDDEVTTYYASLEEVNVKAGTEVKQGDKLGVAGKNVFGKDSGTHVYFELHKDGKEVNPEEYFNQPVSSLNSVTDEVSEKTKSQEKEADPSQEDEAAEESSTEDQSLDKGQEDKSDSDEIEGQLNEQSDSTTKSSKDE
ncbi:MAG: M23 family metallopeptidase [Virgibacillus proomii]|jgi:stage II sporulation protein Q